MGKMAVLNEGPIVMKPIELKGGTFNGKFFHKVENFFGGARQKSFHSRIPGKGIDSRLTPRSLKRLERAVVMGLCGDDRFPSTQQFIQDRNGLAETLRIVLNTGSIQMQVQEIIQGAKILGQRSSGLHIQDRIQLEENILGTSDIIIFSGGVPKFHGRQRLS